MTPRVSVIVTAFNHERYITDAIQSVLDQTYLDYEIIVVDDGSSDATADRVSAFSGQVLLVRQENQGVAGSRNTGVQRARGELLAFLDGDDVWEPDKLAHQVAAADSHPRSGLIVVDGVHFSGPTTLYESLFFPHVTALLDGRESVTLRCYERLLRGNLISSTSQILIPRAVLADVGFSDRRLPVSSDWDLYIRIAASYDITFLHKKLVRWRYLPTSASGPEQLRPLRWAVDHLGILKKHLRWAPSEYRPLIRVLLKQKLAETADQTYWYGRQFDRTYARGQLRALLRQHPFSPTLAGFLLASYLPRPLVRLVGRTLRATTRRPSGP